jgi:small GTP-binding protein
MKAVLLGDCGVGKTAIIKRMVGEGFQERTAATAGGSGQVITVQSSDGRPVTLHLWDTPGSESYRSLVPLYIRDSIVIVIVYDLTQRDSCLYLGEWVTFCRDRGPEHIRLVILGNKTDLEHNRVVDFHEGETFAAENGATFLETSAKTEHEIGRILKHIADEALLGVAPETSVGPTQTLALVESPEASRGTCCNI